MKKNEGRSLWAFTLVVLATGAAVALGRSSASAPDALKATSLTIVDEKGKQRAFFGLQGDGARPELVLLDSDGVQRLRLVLDVHSGAPCIELSDEQSRVGIMLRFDSPVSEASGENHSGVASISIHKEGQALLSLSTGTSEDQSFGKIELLDSRNRQIFVRPDAR